MLTVSNLSAGYGAIRALRGVSLDVAPGEITAVIGANGAGKSTLMRTIAGLLPAWEGSIEFLGQRIDRLPAHRRTPLGLALVPEGRQIFGPLTVLQNLRLGAFHHAGGRNRADGDGDLAFVFDLFPRLKERQTQLGSTLSGGEQQMLAIGRALMSRPRLLLLDEPSLGLAPQVIDTIFNVIERLNHEGLAMLLVEQNATMALEVAQRAYVMEVGQMVLSGTGADLASDNRVRDVYLSVAVEA